MSLLNILSDLHKSTKRDYLARMNDDKPFCMRIARQYGADYWNGHRRYGYGGYYYDGRWQPVAKKLIEHYGIDYHSRVLDVGCGKGYLASDIKHTANCFVKGCDISVYALLNAFIDDTFKCDIGVEQLAFVIPFDLILCINVLHNLTLPHLKTAIQSINQHGKQAYICVDSYRNEQELFNLQCWALTAEQFLRPEEWEFLFKEWGYKGDYEFIFFE